MDSDETRQQEATVWLNRLCEGDSNAAEHLLPLVYDQLRNIANGQFRGQKAEHTLQPTALVHEAYMKLVGSEGTWRDRGHFCAVAATAMRQILIDHARSKRTARREAQRAEKTLENIATPNEPTPFDVVAFDDALTKLGELNPRYARLVELRFLGGMSVTEIANQLGVSDRMLRKDWRNIRAWMNRELSQSEQS
ncbi:MAG: ECF-type sigma factor [Phycisphaerae bacterium]